MQKNVGLFLALWLPLMVFGLFYTGFLIHDLWLGLVARAICGGGSIVLANQIVKLLRGKGWDPEWTIFFATFQALALPSWRLADQVPEFWPREIATVVATFFAAGLGLAIAGLLTSKRIQRIRRRSGHI